MTAALQPSRTVGIAGTTLAHGVLIAAAILMANRGDRNLSHVYEVNLVAAPLPTSGPVRSAPVTPPAPPPVAPPVKQKTAPVLKQKTPPVAKPAAAVPKTTNPVAPLPGAAPSTGRDVVNLHQAGLEFPYPEYLTRIENEILKRWDQSGFRNGLHAAIAFIIMRDGTVPEASLVIEKSSGNKAFDEHAQAAIESASSTHAFGPLPAGFNSASLPILFNFTMTAKSPL